MASIQQIATQWMEQRKTELLENYVRLKFKASGKWGNSLVPVVTETPTGLVLIMKGAKHTGIMINGREKNKNQNPDAIRAFVGWAGSTYLKQWVKDKGIDINPFAVAYKIARFGVKAPNPNVLDNVITDAKVKQLLNSLFRAKMVEFKSEFKWQ